MRIAEMTNDRINRRWSNQNLYQRHFFPPQTVQWGKGDRAWARFRFSVQPLLPAVRGAFPKHETEPPDFPQWQEFLWPAE